MNTMRASVGLGLALALAFVLGVGADARGDVGPGPPDGGASLLLEPSGSGAPPAQSGSETSGRPPPRALDSKRTPMPDRLALPEDLQTAPLAPPTPYVPDNSGTSNKTGSGSNRVNQIFKGATGGAPADLPRDSVTRTPEDQLAPPTYPAEGPR
jgi:hypothetical protein